MRIAMFSVVSLLACSKQREPTHADDLALRPARVCLLATAFRQQADAQRTQVVRDRTVYTAAVRDNRPGVELAHKALTNQLEAVASTRRLMSQTLHAITSGDSRFAPLAQLAHDLVGPPLPDDQQALDLALVAQRAGEVELETECERLLGSSENR